MGKPTDTPLPTRRAPHVEAIPPADPDAATPPRAHHGTRDGIGAAPAPGAPAPGGALPEPRTAFRANDVAASRYRIVRFVAQGGMGEIYEAEDEELGVRVALKTVRPEVARDGRTIARFKREIRLARMVTHPNVCRTFDLGLHQTETATIHFCTMELLTGESLGRRLRRLGRMPAVEALPIARQMALALDAAHKGGVIHRDFKSDNVVLIEVPDDDDTDVGGVRAVVTDFGLARYADGGLSASLSATGGLIGTPDYMAPEQLEGKEVGPGADIYALGVVMFEMVTGALPFGTDSTPLIDAAVERLKKPPPSPRALVPELDRYWEDTILRCLERRPEDRFQRARDVADALPEPPGTRRLRRPRRRSRARLWVTLAVLVTAAATGLLYFHPWTPDPPLAHLPGFAPIRGESSPPPGAKSP